MSNIEEKLDELEKSLQNSEQLLSENIEENKIGQCLNKERFCIKYIYICIFIILISTGVILYLSKPKCILEKTKKTKINWSQFFKWYSIISIILFIILFGFNHYNDFLKINQICF